MSFRWLCRVPLILEVLEQYTVPDDCRVATTVSVFDRARAGPADPQSEAEAAEHLGLRAARARPPPEGDGLLHTERRRRRRCLANPPTAGVSASSAPNADPDVQGNVIRAATNPWNPLHSSTSQPQPKGSL